MKWIGIVCILLFPLTPHAQETSTTWIDVEIQWPDTFSHSFGWFGDEEGIWIHDPADHADYEELAGLQWKERVYFYKPQEGFLGPDSCVLIAHTGSDGASEPAYIDTTIFLFNVEATNSIQAINSIEGFYDPINQRFKTIEPCQLTVYDISGTLRMQGQASIELDPFPHGLYFIVAQTKNQQRVFKVMR